MTDKKHPDDSTLFDESFDDWGEYDEEVDPYITHETDKQNEHSEKLTDWMCHKCNFANNRHSAVKNDCKCTNCGADLIVIEPSIALIHDNKDDEESKYNEQIEHKNDINIDAEIALSLQQQEELMLIKEDNTTITIHSKKSKAETISKYNNKSTGISKLMLPDHTSSIPLPIDMDVSNQKTQVQLNDNSVSMKRVAMFLNVYRPSLFNGIYGSYYYTRTFSPFPFPPHEIKTNVTATNTRNISIKCKLSDNLEHGPYFIHFRNGKKIEINKELSVLLSLSTLEHSDFGQDLLPLLYDHFSRFKIISEINKLRDNSELFVQLYWKDGNDNVHKTVFITSKFSEKRNRLNTEYDKRSDHYTKILAIDNDIIKVNLDVDDELFDICQADYNSIEFRFISSNLFYHSLHQKIITENYHRKLSPKITEKYHRTLSPISLFSNAFKIYEDMFGNAMSLSRECDIKINDNIFVYWIYIWCMSMVTRQYIENKSTYNSTPLQIDLVIIPNQVIDMKSNEVVESKVGIISERLTANNISFNNNNNKKIICNPSRIDSLLRI
eukprot:20093_1